MTLPMWADFSWKKSGAKWRVSLKGLWKYVTQYLCLLSTLHHFCSWRNLSRKYKFLSTVILPSTLLVWGFFERKYIKHPNSNYTEDWEIFKAHECWKYKGFFFSYPLLCKCLFLAFSDLFFFLFHDNRQDTLTVTCNRKQKANHIWK